MKIMRYVTMLAVAAGLFSACQDLDEMKTFDPEKVVAPSLHALPSEIVITPENMAQTQVFAWDAADFGVLTQINYSIEASLGNGEKTALFSGIDGTSSEQTYEVLNAKLMYDLGVPSETPSDVNFYISATIGTDYKTYYSEAVTVKVTVTEAERSYPTVWIIGDYCGWDHGKSQFLFSFSGDEVNYEAIVDFGEKAANGFKLTGIAGWDDSCNWGLDGDAPAPDAEAASVTLISSGGSKDIKIYSKRFYRLSFNKETLTLTNKLSFDQIGVIGDFNGWGGDVVMNFDAAKQRFWADVEFPADGGFKFRLNGAWDTSFGGSNGMLNSGDNIPVTAGKYRVYANLNNSEEMTYELNAADYGQGGGTPDPDPEPDPEPDPDPNPDPEPEPSNLISFETSEGMLAIDGKAVQLGDITVSGGSAAGNHHDVFWAKGGSYDDLAVGGVYNGYLCSTSDEKIWFGTYFSADIGYGDYWGGFVLSANYGRTATSVNYANQFMVWADKGANGSSNCMIGYFDGYTSGYATPMIEFVEPRQVSYLYMANSAITYPYKPTQVDEASYYYKVKITGSLEGKETGSAECFLINGSEKLSDWKKVDLSALGKVDCLTFSPASNEANAYGLLVPAYFAIDEIGLIAEK